MFAAFKPGDLTLFGIEYEGTIVDRVSGEPRPEAEQIVRQLSEADFRGDVSVDMFSSTLEYATGICASLDEARADMERFGRHLMPCLDEANLGLLGMGLHPSIAPEDAQVADRERYVGLVENLQWAVRQLSTNGLHVHVGMPDGDTAISVARQLRYFAPLLVALSASSPLSRGHLTGLASTRSLLWRGFPRSGSLPAVESWAHYVAYVEAMEKSGAVPNPLDYWWDIRPKPELGTLEIRLCDTVPSLDDVLALTSLIRCLTVALAEGVLEAPRMLPGIIDENLWRATRDGVDARFIVDEAGSAQGVPEFAADVIQSIMEVGDRLHCGDGLEVCRRLAEGQGAHQDLVRVFEACGVEGVVTAARIDW